MVKLGYLRPWWLWLGALATGISVLAYFTGGDENPWIGAALVGAAVFVGGMLVRVLHKHQPVPKPREVAWNEPALYVGAAFWVGGLAIGLTASENMNRGDFRIVAGISAVWIPGVVLVMRRFASHAGRAAAGVGAWTATVIPLGRALPDSVLGVARPIVVGLSAGALVLFVQWAWSVGRASRQDVVPPVVQR